MSQVSVVILTLNEQVNIADCLASCRWSDDVHVLDSGSTDQTCQIARDMGAQLHQHPFKSFGEQRNWAIDNIPHKHDWVFHLDADERFTPELVAEMDRVLGANPSEAGFFVPDRMMFMGRWLKLSAGFPVYQVRLFHRQRLRFVDYGHGQRESTSGVLGRLKQPYLHYNFSKGLDDWLEKHNRYSTLEALQIIKAEREPLGLADLFSMDAVRRRRAQKRVWFRMPWRSTLRWLDTMFVLGGALEGQAGWTYASLLAIYEAMIAVKLRELRRDRLLAAEAATRPAGVSEAQLSGSACRD